MPGVDIDMPGLPDIQVVAGPFSCPAFGDRCLDPGIVAAGNDQAGKRESLLKQSDGLAKSIRVCRRNEKGTVDSIRTRQCCSDRGQAAETVRYDTGGLLERIDFFL